MAVITNGNSDYTEGNNMEIEQRFDEGVSNARILLDNVFSCFSSFSILNNGGRSISHAKIF